ncbi:MAG: carboxypeptidase-like regulatory domain-containing protein [Blastocatellia bacterium]
MPITVRKFSQAALLVCGLSVWYFGADWLRASAQSVVGRISGTVTDASGATVSGASVTITNDETKLTRGATTDENGFYIVTNLPAGNYSVGGRATGL